RTPKSLNSLLSLSHPRRPRPKARILGSPSSRGTPSSKTESRTRFLARLLLYTGGTELPVTRASPVDRRKPPGVGNRRDQSPPPPNCVLPPRFLPLILTGSISLFFGLNRHAAQLAAQSSRGSPSASAQLGPVELPTRVGPFGRVHLSRPDPIRLAGIFNFIFLIFPYLHNNPSTSRTRWSGIRIRIGRSINDRLDGLKPVYLEHLTKH
ncbi:hypothetical protein CRG98_001509, partial [Punica granatum]